MSASKFEELLKYLATHLIRKPIKREPIQPPECACVTLRFLETSDAFNTTAANYRKSESFLSI